MSVIDFNQLPMYQVNADLSFDQANMPLPDCKEGLPYQFQTYEDVDEPIFDPAVHLNLQMPGFVKTFPGYEKVAKAKDGNLAYCKPCQVLSKEGLKVIRKIVKREMPDVAPSRGSRTALRGVYYTSPWFRDFHSSPLLLDHVSAIAGERLVVTHDLPSAPQINSSVPGVEGAAEFWHWDSINYVGNFLINDMKHIEGGDLEIIKMEKRAGMKALVNGNLKPEQLEKVSYEAPGKMMLCQGSEILHHVTPIRSSLKRTVVILAFARADVFKPDKMVMQTYVQEDKPRGNKSGLYEFFRGRSWVCGNALMGMTRVVPYTEDGEQLATRLRSVAEELKRCADLIEEKTNDTIGFFDETKNKFEEDWIKKIEN